MWFRRGIRLGPEERMVLAGLLAAPTFELLPLKSAHERAAILPPGSTISVTASPAMGIEATIDLCESLEATGFVAVPHLAARMIHDRAHLADLLARLRGIGTHRVFVVGGDTKEPGAFLDGLSLLRAMADLGHPFTEIGVPCYPEGHAFIPDGALLEALRAKAEFATSMTTQLCFDAAAIATWLTARRTEGIALPVRIGIPGVAEPHRLLAIGARIGVADSRGFLSKNTRFAARLVRSGGFYRPDGLLEGLAATAARSDSGIVDLHVYTFNNVGPTESWRRRYLERLADPAAA